MCELFEPYIKAKYVGYKVLIKRDGRYLSTATEHPYTTGNVPVTPKAIILSRNYDYINNISGKTSVFRYKKDARAWRRHLKIFEEFRGIELVIVRVTISKRLRLGTLCKVLHTISGDYVNNIGKEVQ